MKTQLCGLMCLFSLLLATIPAPAYSEETSAPAVGSDQEPAKIQDDKPAAQPESKVAEPVQTAPEPVAPPPIKEDPKPAPVAPPPPAAAPKPAATEEKLVGFVAPLMDLAAFYQTEINAIKKLAARWNERAKSSLARLAEVKQEIAATEKEISSKSDSKQDKKEAARLKKQAERLGKTQKEIEKRLQEDAKELMAEVKELSKEAQGAVRDKFLSTLEGIKGAAQP